MNKSYNYILAIVVIVVLAIAVLFIFDSSITSYLGSSKTATNNKSSISSTIATTIPTTVTINNTSTANTTKLSYCNTQPAFVYIGNSIACGSFTATILSATSTNISLRATYNGISINKTVTNQKGYVGNTFALNFSGTVVFGRVWGYFPSNQTVYFQMSTAPVALTTTITLPTTSTTTVNSTTSTSTPVMTSLVVGGSQCVFGCTHTAQFSVSALTSSNAIASQTNYETLIASWSGGSAPYSANFTITNSSNGDVIANGLYTGISSTSNAFTFQIPFTNNALGQENLKFIVYSNGNNAQATNTITANAAPITYSYNGVDENSASSLAVALQPSSYYFCDATGYQGTLGPSWTSDVSPDFWTSIGHQSGNDICSVTQLSSSEFALTGVGVANVSSYSASYGSNTLASYVFTYNSVGTNQYTFILLSGVQYTLNAVGVNPSSGTCTGVENEETAFFLYSYVMVCSGQTANTYSVTVTPSGESSTYPAAWAVYTVT